ncbi:MAG: site-2 protease family protein, partial [Cyanobacteria bacterium J06641_5]
MAWNSSETLLTAAVVAVAAGVLIWGWLRSRPYGRLGLLSWLQSLVLMLPWLLFFGLFAAGVYINLIGILMLLVLSSGAYIYLGRRLRAAGQEELLRDRAAQRLQKQQERAPAPANDGDAPETAGTPPIPAG